MGKAVGSIAGLTGTAKWSGIIISFISYIRALSVMTLDRIKVSVVL